MNWFQIAGAILSILAAICIFIGTYQQSKKDTSFQKDVGNFVDGEKRSNVPNIVGITVVPNGNNYSLIVKNIGKKPAINVTLIFHAGGTPDILSGTFASKNEIPNGIVSTFPIDIFNRIELLTKFPNSDKNWEERFKKSLNEFNSGEGSFIQKFHLEYFFEKKKFISDTYFLLINKRGVVSFRKETS